MDLEDLPPAPTPSSNRLKALAELKKMHEIEFNHAGHGELPVRPDSSAYLLEVIFHPSHDEYWDNLTLEAVGLYPAGIPWFQFVSPVTRRRIVIQAPCWGVVGLIQAYPDVNRGLVTRESEESQPQINNFNRAESLDSPGWETFAKLVSWAKSTLLVPGFG